MPQTTAIEKHEFKTKEEWLAFRKTKVTASELAVILGISTWGSPYSLWTEKVGLEDSFEDTMHQKIGHYLEDAILNLYQDETGRSVTKLKPFTMYVNPEFPLLAATPDAFQFKSMEHVSKGNLQVKTANVFKRNEWNEDMPLVYQCQTQVEMFTTGLTWGSICALFGGGSDFLWYDYEINPKFIDAIKPKVEEFMEYVKREMPPPLDDTEHTLNALKALYPNDNGEQMDLPADAIGWDSQYVTLEAELKELNKLVKEKKGIKRGLESHLRKAIGDNTFGKLPNGTQYTLTTTNRKGYTVEPKSFRKLRRKEK